MVRIGGRLQKAEFRVRHPILLSKYPLAKLIIKDAHEGRMLYLKTEAVMAELSESYCIIRTRKFVKSSVRECMKCRRDTAKMADVKETPLPACRVEQSFIRFKAKRLDYLEPFVIKYRSRMEGLCGAGYVCGSASNSPGGGIGGSMSCGNPAIRGNAWRSSKNHFR